MTDITPYLNRADMLQETAEQIIKDFGMLGMEIKISQASNTTYPELFSVLLPLIEKLQKKNTQSFYSLMYRIDISEGQIKKAVEDSKNRSFSEVLTDLILKRELLKVVIRKHYSEGNEL